MSELPAALALPESRCDSNEGFRTAPWFILGESSIKSNGTALVLSVIWHSLQSGRDDRTSPKTSKKTCKIPNKEIAKRAGLNCKSEAIRHHLVRLEKLGFIKRHGNHRNRIIECALNPPPNGDTKGLTISTNSDLSPTQRLVVAIQQAFPNMSKDKICCRLGIKIWTLNHVLRTLEPPNESPANPLMNHPELPNESPTYIGIEGRARVKGLSKDNPKCAIHTNAYSEEKKMIHPETYGREYDSLIHQSTRNKKPPTRSAEIDDYFTPLPNSTKHEFPGKPYEAAKRTVRALAWSPNRVLKPEEVARLAKTALSQKRFTKQQVQDFLSKKFSFEERVEIYRRLSNYYDRTYRRTARGHANLATALYNPYLDGLSIILEVWYYPPKPMRVPTVAIDEKLHPIVDMIMEIVGGEDSRAEAQVRKNIKHLHWLYEKTIRPNMKEETKYHYGSFRSFMRGFINWAVDKYSGLTPVPGWFSSSSKPFRQWEKIMREWTNDQSETSDWLEQCQAGL